MLHTFGQADSSRAQQSSDERARKLIDSKFEMAVGETVVVGTSRLGGGDKGLVVLLTAVPASTKSLLSMRVEEDSRAEGRKAKELALALCLPPCCLTSQLFGQVP